MCMTSPFSFHTHSLWLVFNPERSSLNLNRVKPITYDNWNLSLLNLGFGIYCKESARTELLSIRIMWLNLIFAHSPGGPVSKLGNTMQSPGVHSVGSWYPWGSEFRCCQVVKSTKKSWVECSAHNTAYSTQTSSSTDQNVFISVAGRPALQCWQNNMYKWITIMTRNYILKRLPWISHSFAWNICLAN